MAKFKVGDRVKIKDNKAPSWCNNIIPCDEVYIIEDSTLPYFSKIKGGDVHGCVDENSIELVEELIVQPQKDYSFSLKPELTNNKTIMSNLITTFKNITRSEPNKTFVKAGVMNEDLSLTNEGQQLFIQYLFDTYADEFKTKVVDKIIAEQEKK